jgi:hypothetical protein
VSHTPRERTLWLAATDIKPVEIHRGMIQNSLSST